MYRSGQPNELNFPYLEKLRLRTVLFLSPEDPSTQLLQFTTDHGIKLVHPSQQASPSPGSAITEEIALDALHIILNPANYPLLITCNLGRHHTGTVVGCLRKFQKWNLTSIFEEYRRYAGGKVKLLNEQFIEFFDTDQVSVPLQRPRWLAGLTTAAATATTVATSSSSTTTTATLIPAIITTNSSSPITASTTKATTTT